MRISKKQKNKIVFKGKSLSGATHFICSILQLWNFWLALPRLLKYREQTNLVFENTHPIMIKVPLGLLLITWRAFPYITFFRTSFLFVSQILQSYLTYARSFTTLHLALRQFKLENQKINRKSIECTNNPYIDFTPWQSLYVMYYWYGISYISWNA